MGVVHAGERNPNWRGGRVIASNGYVLIRVGKGHHLADVRGYAYEHRLVAEEKLGRRLEPDEIVHHLDEDKRNNAPENVHIFSSIGEHLQAHGTRLDRRRVGASNPLIDCACGCGSRLEQFDSSGRPRRFITGHNMRRT
jgi:hypothetical protein